MLSRVTTGQGKKFLRQLVIWKHQALLFCFLCECLYVVFKNLEICTVRFERRWHVKLKILSELKASILKFLNFFVVI